MPSLVSVKGKDKDNLFNSTQLLTEDTDKIKD